jgi:hypothetical protein
VAIESIVPRLTLDFQAYELQAFPNFHLMVFAIAGAHGGHALRIQRRHVASYTSSQDQTRTNQQRAKSHRRRSDEVPIHRSFLRNDVVSVSPRLAGCDSVHWCVSGALSTPIVLSKPYATHPRPHGIFFAVPYDDSLSQYFCLT